jgi:hypothetical protein
MGCFYLMGLYVLYITLRMTFFAVDLNWFSLRGWRYALSLGLVSAGTGLSVFFGSILRCPTWS